MPVEILDTPFQKHLYGTTKPVLAGQKPGEVMAAAMNSTWNIVRKAGIPNAGINHILYTGANSVFAGVEVEAPVDPSLGLEPRDILFPRYAYYRHTGPWDQLGQVYQTVGAAINAQHLVRTGLSLEIYGHMETDPAKQVTEILIGLKLASFDQRGDKTR